MLYCSSLRFRRIPATPFACARTPARRCTWSSHWGFAWMTRVCSDPALIITILRPSKFTLASTLASNGSPARGLLPWKPRGATATAILSTARAMRLCLGVKPADSRKPCWIESDEKRPCSFPCGRTVAASIYPMPWRSSPTKPGVSSTSPVPRRQSNPSNLTLDRPVRQFRSTQPRSQRRRHIASLHGCRSVSHSASERISRPISACTAARTGLSSCMTR